MPTLDGRPRTTFDPPEHDNSHIRNPGDNTDYRYYRSGPNDDGFKRYHPLHGDRRIPRGYSTTYDRLNHLAEHRQVDWEQDQRRVPPPKGVEMLPRTVVPRDKPKSKCLGRPGLRPVASDPNIRQLMREIIETETGAADADVNADPMFVRDIARRQKIDHITGIMIYPRRPIDDVANTHVQYNRHDSYACPKGFHRQKNMYTDYVETWVKQKHLMADKGPKVADT
eukprot:gnl/TRDRNA2_/TRDRNA2_180742_c0_seq1.p1 gnl/TRDRNA2_/TRDRNA2_180742_c0~~gnl/TRDRNA2_/TRDRNA2_180742_c0_seq1.p1  ORF type:complete len:225 (+),score=23.71 gnl/TRDRNA2_/TRDRNA2_180742_c0_seq1:63-737(+)